MPDSAVLDAPAAIGAPLPVADFGGRYTARDNGDSTYTIFDVPIVGLLEKGARTEFPEFEIDAAWLRKALARFQVRESEGYLPPLHVWHHTGKTQIPRGGFFRPIRVGELTYEGKKTRALFANLERVPRSLAVAIARGEWPYRSIEFKPNAEPEIESLALLDTEVPQFRFPVLTVGRTVTQYAELPVGVDAGGALCFASTSKGLQAALFRFDPEQKDESDDEDGDEERLGDASEDSDDEDGEGDEGEEDQVIAKSGDGAVLALLKKIYALLAPAQEAAADATDPETGTRGPVDPKTMSDTEKDKSAKAADPEIAGQMAAMRSELAALQAKDAARERDKVVAQLAGDAEKSLRAEGYALDDATKADLVAFAADGKDKLDRFVASFKRTAQKDPPSRHEESLRAAPASPEADGVLEKFRNRGPEVYERARVEAARYARDPHAQRRMTLERFIECSLESGMQLVSASAFEKDED